MTINTKIDMNSYENSVNEILSFEKHTRHKIKIMDELDELDIYESIITMQRKYNQNSIINSLLIDFILLSNNPLIHEQYSLEDIEKLLLLNIQLNPDNISYINDILHYYWNVMDDYEKTQEYILLYNNVSSMNHIEIQSIATDLENEKSGNIRNEAAR